MNLQMNGNDDLEAHETRNIHIILNDSQLISKALMYVETTTYSDQNLQDLALVFIFTSKYFISF